MKYILLLLLSISIQAQDLKDFYPIYEFNGFSLMYNPATKNPIWVMYLLSRADVIAEEDRSGESFRRAIEIPDSADPKAYKGTEYDIGHMKAFADGKGHFTFIMPNSCPQQRGLNRGLWLKLEKHVRTLAMAGNTLLIVTGPTYTGTCDRLTDGTVIPSGFFKIIKNLDTSEVKCYSIPNIDIDNGAFVDYECSLSEIENLIGLRFKQIGSTSNGTKQCYGGSGQP